MEKLLDRSNWRGGGGSSRLMVVGESGFAGLYHLFGVSRGGGDIDPVTQAYDQPTVPV
ncbi:MAG TPA: hypothetical protein VKV18_04110 [Chthonomonas sp.]|uniref:hypothetical protein n=1 Tax=Chthonomonas sp. TaxID=2282153 RepID=UPI002B4ACED8|nr:hypothetical protein [Chthonomonas sp.]HLI47859.1 hypothetical protein [Chthonomonas sp.]